jgi:hypothetical protein
MTDMSIRRAALLFLITGLAATSASAAPRSRDVSWGKPGVEYDQYRLDAAQCAIRALDLDISQAEPTRILVYASRALETADNAWGVTIGNPAVPTGHPSLLVLARAERQFERIAEIQQATLDQCLVERGYQPFRLTGEQRRQLRRLPEGSPERRAFLHGLAADPAVLGRQRLDTTSPVPPQG